MGFFDKLFGGKHDAAPKFAGEKMTVMAPIDGTVIPLEQIPDETFATAILGPGCGIEPTGDTVYAPFDGTITHVYSRFAFIFQSMCVNHCHSYRTMSQKVG